jgi:hypothetical protein
MKNKNNLSGPLKPVKIFPAGNWTSYLIILYLYREMKINWILFLPLHFGPLTTMVFIHLI